MTRDEVERASEGAAPGEDAARGERRGRPGRPPAFELLLTQVIVSGGPRLLRLAASFCPQEAEDILNTAAERALAHPQAFAHGEAALLYRWLETTVRRECLKTLRARGRELLMDPAQVEDVAGPAGGLGPHQASVATQERIATLEALAGLHPVEASCLALSARGFSRAEIAEMLAITPLTVKRRLEEARESMGVFSHELGTGRRCARLRRSLSSYADGDLAGPERQRLVRHLDHCGRCRGRLLALRRQRARLESALPPCLVLLLAERSAAGDERELELGRQLAEVADEGWLAFASGFWARVLEGWYALTPIARLAGAGAAALLALAGIGTVAGQRDQAPPVAQEAAAPATIASAKPDPASPTRATQRPSGATGAASARAGDPGSAPKAQRAPKPAAAASARAGATGSGATVRASTGSSPTGPSVVTPVAESSPTPAEPVAEPAPAVDAESLARAEFEPGPP